MVKKLFSSRNRPGSSGELRISMACSPGPGFGFRGEIFFRKIFFLGGRFFRWGNASAGSFCRSANFSDFRIFRIFRFFGFFVFSDFSDFSVPGPKTAKNAPARFRKKLSFLRPCFLGSRFSPKLFRFRFQSQHVSVSVPTCLGGLAGVLLF